MTWWREYVSKTGIVPEWKAERIEDRLSKCRAMLYLHGVLTEGENVKVSKRIKSRVRPQRDMVSD